MQDELDDEFVHAGAYGTRQGFVRQMPEALAYGDVLPPGFTLIQPRSHSTTVPRAVPGADPL